MSQKLMRANGNEQHEDYSIDVCIRMRLSVALEDAAQEGLSALQGLLLLASVFCIVPRLRDLRWDFTFAGSCSVCVSRQHRV